MLGAIAGDMIGSVFEHHPTKHTDFELWSPGSTFTDDTVLTVATADAILGDGDYAAAFRRWANAYPGAGYGGWFRRWAAQPDHGPYNSFGNGSAMRVSPVGWAFDTLEETLAEAARNAAPTHDHPEGIKGAQAVAGAVFLARTGASKSDILSWAGGTFDYDLDRTLDDIRPTYRFDVTCQGSVPEAILAFAESESPEHAIRLAISLGGDADTQGAIAGAIAEAFFGGLPETLATKVRDLLDHQLQQPTTEFRAQYCIRE